jgi:hypothetical protein
MTRPFEETRGMASVVADRGYAVLPQVVPRDALERALRHLHLDVVRRGLPPEVLGSWLWSSHWFPHLRWDPPVVALAGYLPEELRHGEMCDPQIILQPPDDCEDEPVTSHVDQEPEWADGRRYRTIVGVPLTPAHTANGGLVVWPFDTSEQEALELVPGDVVVMHPQLPHSSGLNREGAIRYAVYFRFLEPRENAA